MMRFRHRPWIFVVLAASLAAATSCQSEVDATASKKVVAEAEPPPPSGAALLLLGVEPGRKSPVALLRIQNIGETVVSYRSCGVDAPRWTRQERVGDEWKDVATSECEAPRIRHLGVGEGIKFRVVLAPNAPATRVGVEVVDSSTGGATVLWSETVGPE